MFFREYINFLFAVNDIKQLVYLSHNDDFKDWLLVLFFEHLAGFKYDCF